LPTTPIINGKKIGVVAYFLFNFFNTQKLKKFQFIILSFFLIILITILGQSLNQINKKFETNKVNKDAFNSYTPDFQNYMLASKWAGDNLPSNSIVLCRKPDMSWIASNGKDIFKGIFKLEYDNPDSTLAMIKRYKATHVIMANLRGNPEKKTDKTINTITNTLIYLTAIRPACLKTLKEFGTDEKAYVFEINLNEKLSMEEFYKNIDAALIVNPKNYILCDDKGKYLLSQNKPQDALKYYNFALNYSKEPVLVFNRGLCFFQLRKYPEALSDFKKACELKPDFNQSWYNLSLCYFMLKDYSNSKYALSKAKDLGFKDYQELENQLFRIN
jgi:tetratricopeptide (TPR) repeat protein